MPTSGRQMPTNADKHLRAKQADKCRQAIPLFVATQIFQHPLNGTLKSPIGSRQCAAVGFQKTADRRVPVPRLKPFRQTRSGPQGEDCIFDALLNSAVARGRGRGWGRRNRAKKLHRVGRVSRGKPRTNFLLSHGPHSGIRVKLSRYFQDLSSIVMLITYSRARRSSAPQHAAPKPRALAVFRQ
jgi:hypothetical protein